MKSVAFLVCILFSATVLAGPARLAKLDGQDYLCLELEFATETLQVIKEKYPLTKEALEEARLLIENYKVQVQNLELVIEDRNQIIGAQIDYLKSMQEELADLRVSQEDQWGYYTMFTVGGFVVGAGLAVLIVYAVKGEL